MDNIDKFPSFRNYIDNTGENFNGLKFSEEDQNNKNFIKTYRKNSVEKKPFYSSGFQSQESSLTITPNKKLTLFSDFWSTSKSYGYPFIEKETQLDKNLTQKTQIQRRQNAISTPKTKLIQKASNLPRRDRFGHTIIVVKRKKTDSILNKINIKKESLIY